MLSLGHGILAVAARRFPDRPALIGDFGEITFGQLEARVARCAGGLRRLGIGPGDRVGYMMNNFPEVIVAYFAILRAGAVAVAVNVMLKPAELTHVLTDSEAVALVCEPDVVGTVLAARTTSPALRHVVVLADPPPPGTLPYRALEDGEPMDGVVDRHPDDVAMIMYTSGTTGTPKGAMMSDFWLEFTAHGWVTVFKLTRDDRVLVASPFFYAMGSIIDVLAPFRVGGAAVLLERFRPRPALDAITRHRPTVAAVVPTAAVQLLEHYDPARDDVSSIRTFFTGGGPNPPGLRERLRARFGWDLRDIYGLTEAHIVGVGHVVVPRREGMLGVPGTNLVVKVVDDQGREVPRGEIGEIVCQGDTVTLGYWRCPQETAEAYRDGWFHTGDLGLMDEEGYVKVVDRKKEMVITGGANIYPTEVEAVLAQHPAVAVAALVGRPDPTYGELPCAFVVLRPGARATAEEIIAHCRAQLAAYKVPRAVVFTEALPVTATGKIARRQLRELAGRESVQGAKS